MKVFTKNTIKTNEWKEVEFDENDDNDFKVRFSNYKKHQGYDVKIEQGE